MFGHKTPMPCDNCLGLDNYKPESFKSKTVWLNQQLNAMLHTNKQALKLIEKSTNCNKDCTGSKELTIPIGNHVLLHDHPEGHNKIQDRYKSNIYVMVGHHKEPNVYYIQLLDMSQQGPPKVVNQHQLYNLNHSGPPSVADKSQEDDDPAVISSFLHPKEKNINNCCQQNFHPYNTRAKCKTATAGRQAEVNTIITHM